MNRKTVVPLAFLAIWCAMGVLLRCTPSTTVLSSRYSVDSLIPLSGAWALHSGLRIHTDFSTPLGLACYLPYYWAMEIFGNTANVMRQVDAADFVVVSLIAFLLFKPPRFNWPTAALGVALLSLIAANPCNFDGSPTIIYEGDRYNFLCIALGLLGLLTTVSGANLGAREAAALAFCLVWAAFVKFNYFVINLSMILAASAYSRMVFGTRWKRFYSWLAGLFALFAAAFVLGYRVDVIGMFRDLHVAAAARFQYVMTMAPNTDYGGTTDYGLSSAFTHILLVFGRQPVALVLLVLGTAWQRSLATGALMAFLLVLDIGQNLFNAYGLVLPLIPGLFMLLLAVAERSSAPALQRVRLGFFLPVILYVGWYAAGHVAAFNANRHPPQHCPTIQAAGYDRIYFENNCEGETLTYAAQWNSGLDLLRSNALADKRVFVVDFINPFPFLLATPFPRGQAVWMHANGTYSREHYIPPETLFSDTDVVLLPRESRAPWNSTALILIYGDWILAHYDLAAKNGHWIAYVKHH